MWSADHLVLLALAGAAAVMSLAAAGLYLSGKFGVHPVAVQITSLAVSIAVAVIFTLTLAQLWRVRQAEDERTWFARAQHLQRLQEQLRRESESLRELSWSLRDGRYLALVANDAREAVWKDEVLTRDVERHYPDYFRDREDLIRRILDHDSEIGRFRQKLAATLTLTALTEPYRATLIPALMKKCAGERPSRAGVDARPAAGPRTAASSVLTDDALTIYDRYVCAADLVRQSQDLFDRAADLAEAATMAGDRARREAEGTLLHGTCTYAP